MRTAPLPAARYAHPWRGESLDYRLACLRTGAFRVAYVTERPDIGTFRYRAHNMVRALCLAPVEVGAAWFSIDELDESLPRLLETVDTLVLCRVRYSARVARLIGMARARRRRLLFDVDDLVFDTRHVHLLLETLDRDPSEAELDGWFGVVGRTGETMRHCDGVVVTNAYLAEQVRAFSGLPCAIVPNFLNEAQLGHSEALLRAKLDSGFASDGRLGVGYFSGSPTHNRDFEVMAPALAEWLARSPRHTLRVVGYLALPHGFAPFAERIERITLQDFLNLQARVAEVELNLVPLQRNRFAECKSELKVFEAAVVGTLSIATPSAPLAEAVTAMRAGWLAQPHEWLDRLTEAAALPHDAHIAMAREAAAAARRRYAPEAVRDRIVAAVRPD